MLQRTSENSKFHEVGAGKGGIEPPETAFFPWYGRLQRRDGHPIFARFVATGRSVVADELGKPECSAPPC